MDTEKALLLFVVVTPVMVAMVYAIYQFTFFIYHWHKVVTNVTNKYAAILGPLLLLRTSNFNEVGQNSLIKAKYHFVRFIFTLLPLSAIVVLGKLMQSNGN